MTKYIYAFEEGSLAMKNLLGGKGANLAEMTRLGFPVPPGFTITTEACREYLRTGELPVNLLEDVRHQMSEVEKKTGKKFGDPNNALLVSVRSGAPISMPGMMDTVLNLGLNDETVKGLSRQTNNERFAYDAYRRFIQMFSDTVLKVGKDLFEQAIQKMKEKKGVKDDTELNPEDLKELVEQFKEIVLKEKGESFPTDPWQQLELAIRAVFESWNNPRAQVYRKQYRIPDEIETAANVQTMVFGNMGNDSATGVCFTRNPSTGEKKVFGEYLVNAQGEDVVAGIRTPQPIEKLSREIPSAYQQLMDLIKKLEQYYREMQDVEFTIERGKLYMLQTRTGKRTAQSALKIAVDMVEEGLITKEEAVQRIDPEQLDHLLHPRIDPDAQFEVLAKGLSASPGAAIGKVVFDADVAEKLGTSGEKVILVRWETTPDDIHGIIPAQGILTAHGGMTSHAAVVARGMGKPAVTGCEEIKIDAEAGLFRINNSVIKEGDIITIDGGTGQVILGEVPLIPPRIGGEVEEILKWADKIRQLGVRANADTPEDAKRAREFGAEGIGLCRTEHMFGGGERLPIMQRTILSETSEERERALSELEPLLTSDFREIFKAMDGFPVTIRLLDPPLHEFLPNYADLRVEITALKLKGASKELIAEKEKLLKEVRSQMEANPMLGLRGCRLGIVFPEIYCMQVRAIVKAACEVKSQGFNPGVEIMIPLVSLVKELEILREMVEEEANKIIEKQRVQLDYKVGTMIELPRAALTADEIGKVADFFSFGTNDLTQTTFGFSRDDAEGKFFPQYLDQKILSDNPFQVLDKSGVGKLVETGTKLGKKTNPNLKVGICGEHGGDPESIHFCHQAGLTYVSCSPFRVPIARLAAAQAQLKEEKHGANHPGH